MLVLAAPQIAVHSVRALPPGRSPAAMDPTANLSWLSHRARESFWHLVDPGLRFTETRTSLTYDCDSHSRRQTLRLRFDAHAGPEQLGAAGLVRG